MATRLVTSASAQQRLRCAREWLAARAPAEEVLIVAASYDAANELLREAAFERGAAFGWHRSTPARLAAALAAEALVAQDAVPLGRLGAQAAVARILHERRREGRGGRLEYLGEGPGLVRALAGVLDELRHARVDPAALEKEAPDLRALFDVYDAALRGAGLADRARVFELAAAAARAPSAHAWLRLPTLLLDVPLESAAESALLAEVAARAPEVLATYPAGDGVGEMRLREALAVDVESLGDDPEGPASLQRLQVHLFEGTAPGEGLPDGAIEVLSAPGESRECVEIARRALQFAREGVAFDRMAILPRSAEEYRPHLAEALGRAGVPVHFARGTRRPDPAGRAFAALLACAVEGLSARRFAEYLSLGEVPDTTPEGAPPAAAPRSERWIAPDEELISPGVAELLEDASRAPDAAEVDLPAAAEDAPVVAGSLRAPRRWERLLVDAAVIGGRARWERRLDGLARELERDLEGLEDPDAAEAERLRSRLADLTRLGAYALPLLDALAALPERASWGDWIECLAGLATRALRHPERVLAVLSELTPMAGVGPVERDEVRWVLEGRLLEVTTPAPPRRYGRVFVAPAEAARGLVFDVVFVPGLAEKLFPKKIQEEPILLDPARARLDAGLAVNDDRVARERLALRLAVGAARRRLVLSYPRLDLDRSRPRVPSFYALEMLRAAEGRLPGFDALAQRAETTTAARVGWPAPARAEDAIDEAEHDLALLESLLRLEPERSVGTARYLLGANPHLGRALRFRARRWLPSWTQADGLLPPVGGELPEAARSALAAHGLAARSFSATALQHFAACPYRFFLYTVHKLAPREVPEAIEELDPLQRGSLVHEVQFELFQALRSADLLPVTAERLDAARAQLDGVLDAVAARYRDELAPAIERLWQDGVESVRADLREWLRRAARDASGFDPWRFELSFGLPSSRARDPHSSDAPVPLDCGVALRGAIDLVERSRDGRIRVTDHKTGKPRVRSGQVVAGGQALQPVLYALAAEKLFPDAPVESGRLSYCTAAGGFTECVVPLDERARASAAALAEVVGDALERGFLPAAPDKGACRWCDYRAICGPYEELRAGRKPQAPLAPLARLRGLP
ncbi:MAG TPA: PD-(D/E)XK nuclease family protein [Myxococcota bacterium]